MKLKRLKTMLACVLCVCGLLAGVAAGVVSDGVSETQAASKNSFISEKAAKTAALKDAGYKAAGVDALYADDTKYNGRKVFKVSFYKQKGGLKYRKFEYTIWARNGQILKKNTKDVTIITKKSALLRALDKKDYTRSEVTDTDSYLTDDDERLVYEVDYTSKAGVDSRGRRDYEFTIDAVTGKVLDWDVDD